MKAYQPIMASRSTKSESARQPVIDTNPVAIELPATSENWVNSPTFSNTVHSRLPKLLADGCQVFSSARERDVWLVSALAVVSGCFPTVCGEYDGRKVKANLFAFVVAPPASGKGVLVWAQQLGVDYHRYRTAECEQLRLDYAERAQQAKQDKQPFEEQPPPYKSLFIPGNSSAAAFLKALKENDETGVVCETEADTLSGALKQDWGDYSDLLRKAFHHERVSYLRKSGERYELEQPAISVLLSGTPGQVRKLIPDAENGLFSRFLFYGYDAQMAWHDVSPQSGRPSFDAHFAPLSEDVKEMALRTERMGGIQFSLQPPQWVQLNKSFAAIINRPVIQEMREAGATAYRLGLITFRLAMILSVLRMYDTGLGDTELYCEDCDFDTALSLSTTLLDHALLVMETLPKGNALRNVGEKQRQLLTQLPAEFSRAEADFLGNQLGIKERTMTNYLNSFVENLLLVKTNHGQYQKPT